MSSWKSFNDVYVPNTGGDITGDLEVSGNLTVNDGSGEGTTYDVAAEITELKDAWDSVSQINVGTGSSVIKRGFVATFIIGENVTLSTWTTTKILTLPEGYRPIASTFGHVATNNLAILCEIHPNGVVQLNPYGTSISNLRMYGSVTYICA